ncbi:unnamed protein product [Linum tenue]|uniref:Uncharacterized protein n=1 Tax=Linum tenue TaxID=586396 RepID=A0AAV0JHL0_9ROSI|nr:unnamed protein product [Linum tenue]
MKQHFQSFRVASGMEFGDEEEVFVEIIEASETGKLEYSLECIRVPRSATRASSPDADDDALPKEMEVVQQQLQYTSLKRQPSLELNAMDNGLEVNNCLPPLENAAKSLGVCPTTMKRICRQHGISRWPSRKINKVNRSLTKLKRVIESVQVADGAFDLTPLTTSPLPVAVSSISWPSCDINNGSKSAGGNGVEDQTASVGSPELPQGLKSGNASREDSAGNSTSHGSCQGSPANGESGPPAKDPDEHSPKPAGGSPLGLPFLDMKLSAAYSIPDALVATTTEAEDEPFGEMLIEDAGSSKDLQNLCSPLAIIEDRLPESSGTNPPTTAQTAAANNQPVLLDDPALIRGEAKKVIIKAMYKEDIIRFRISAGCGLMELKEEVGKRLKLDIGVFDIKYLDDDNEWVLIVCDADLQECIDITRSSSRCNMIRLSIHDVSANFGSSCESTGGGLR